MFLRSAAGGNNENSALLTASAVNGVFNPRASVPSSTVSSLLPSAAAAVAAQSVSQQRFSTQTGLFGDRRRVLSPVFSPILFSTRLQPCCDRQVPAAARGVSGRAALLFERCRFVRCDILLRGREAHRVLAAGCGVFCDITSSRCRAQYGASNNCQGSLAGAAVVARSFF